MKLTITAAATLAIAGAFGGLAACSSQTVKPAAARPAATHTATTPTNTAPSTRSVLAYTAKRAAARRAAARRAAARRAAVKRAAAQRAAAQPAPAQPAGPVGQAEVGQLLEADEAAVTSAAGGTNGMRATYLANAIEDQRAAWDAVLNTPGLSASAQAGITDWLAFADQIQAYHGGGTDRARVLAAGASAQEELASAYPQLAALLQH